MHRSFRLIGALVAPAALAATAAFAAPGAPVSPVRYAKPSDASLLPGGMRHPEPIGEAMAAAQFHEQRTGIIDPARAQQALLEAQAKAAAIRPAAGAYGRGWTELGPKPYVTDDPEYDDIYGGTSGTGWTVVSGRVTTLALDPNDRSGKTVWVGTAGGGVWVTRNGGTSWKSVWDGQAALAIGAIAFDQSRPKTMYVGTGEGNLGGGTMFRGIGVFRSTDGGKSFVRVPKNVVANVVSRIEARAGKVYVATDRGLWVSTDGGNSYKDARLPTNAGGTAPQNGLFGTVVTDVKIHPVRSNQVTAAVGWPRGKLYTPGNGLYRSLKSGAPGTWTRMDVESLKQFSKSGDPIGRISLAYATGEGQDHEVLWAIVQDPGLLNRQVKAGAPNATGTVLNGVYRSADDGATWTLKGTNETFIAAPGNGIVVYAPLGYSPGVQAWYNQWLLVSPSDENVVLVGLEEIYQTTANATGPGLAAWTTVGRYWNICTSLINVDCATVPVGPYAGKTTHPDQHAAVMTADGKRLYAGNDGGVFVQDTTDGKYSNMAWNSVNATLGTTQPYYATMAADGTVYTGFQDNGVAKITPDGYGVAVFGGDGGDVAVEPDDSNRAWEEFVGAVTSVTKDGGKTWINNAPEVTSPQFISPFEMDPKDQNHVVLGAREILETTKGVDTICAHDYVASGTYPPANPVTCDWKIAFDLGQNTSVTPPVNFSTTAIDVDGAVLYAGYCGTCGLVSSDPTSDGKTKTGLATNRKPGCTPVTGAADCWHHAKAKGLPNRFISDVTIDPRNLSVVYVTMGGYSRRWLPITSRTKNVGRGHVFVSRNAGESFTDISKNLPDEPSESLEIKGDRLFVATHSGVYTAAKSGAAWERLGKGLPNTYVMDINLNPQGTKLVVATHGRGVWSYAFGPSVSRGSGASQTATRSGVSTVSAPAGPKTMAAVDSGIAAGARRTQPSSGPATVPLAGLASLAVAALMRRRRRA